MGSVEIVYEWSGVGLFVVTTGLAWWTVRQESKKAQTITEERLDRQDRDLIVIRSQLKRNGGSSMFDRIERIEQALNQLIGEFREHARQHEGGK